MSKKKERVKHGLGFKILKNKVYRS
jgi:hypothetical protein